MVVCKETSCGGGTISRLATHGQYRWQQQFRLDEMLRELLLIRDILIAEIDRYLAEHEPSAANVLLEAGRRVGRFFDDVLLYSASQFAEQH